MGSEGYLHQPVPRAAHQPPHRRLGRHRREPRCASRSRSCARVREAVGADFIIIYRLSLLDLVDGRPDLGRGRRRWPRASRRPARRHQHRHRLARGAGADDRHPGAARRLRRRHRAAQGRGVASRSCASNRINMPESPRRSSPPASADLVSMARPLLADPDFVRQGRRAAAPTRSTPASPATRPASTTSSPTRRASCLVNPRAVPRDRAGARADPRAQARRRRRRRPGRARRRGDRWPSAATRSTLFEARRRRRRPVRPRDADPRQGGVRRDAALLHAGGSSSRGVEVRLGRRADADDLDAASTRSCVATGVVPRMPDIPGIDHPMVVTLRRRAPRRAHRRASGWPSSAPAASASTSASSSPHEHSPTLDVDEWMAEWGVGDPAATPRRADRAAAPTPRRARCTCCSARPRPIGKGLGKTTGWVHRAALKAKGVAAGHAA